MTTPLKEAAKKRVTATTGRQNPSIPGDLDCQWEPSAPYASLPQQERARLQSTGRARGLTFKCLTHGDTVHQLPKNHRPNLEG